MGLIRRLGQRKGLAQDDIGTAPFTFVSPLAERTGKAVIGGIGPRLPMAFRSTLGGCGRG